MVRVTLQGPGRKTILCLVAGLTRTRFTCSTSCNGGKGRASATAGSDCEPLRNSFLAVVGAVAIACLALVAPRHLQVPRRSRARGAGSRQRPLAAMCVPPWTVFLSSVDRGLMGGPRRPSTRTREVRSERTISRKSDRHGCDQISDCRRLRAGNPEDHLGYADASSAISQRQRVTKRPRSSASGMCGPSRRRTHQYLRMWRRESNYVPLAEERRLFLARWRGLIAGMPTS